MEQGPTRSGRPAGDRHGAEPPSGGLVVGLGARRGVRADAVRALLDRVAGAHGLDLTGARYATVEARAGDPGLLAALDGVVPAGCPAAELARVDVPNRSERVAAAAGTPSVAEAAALLTATRLGGPGAAVTLVVPKTAGAGVTAAVARYERR